MAATLALTLGTTAAVGSMALVGGAVIGGPGGLDVSGLPFLASPHGVYLPEQPRPVRPSMRPSSASVAGRGTPADGPTGGGPAAAPTLPVDAGSGESADPAGTPSAPSGPGAGRGAPRPAAGPTSAPAPTSGPGTPLGSPTPPPASPGTIRPPAGPPAVSHPPTTSPPTTSPPTTSPPTTRPPVSQPPKPTPTPTWTPRPIVTPPSKPSPTATWTPRPDPFPGGPGICQGHGKGGPKDKKVKDKPKDKLKDKPKVKNLKVKEPKVSRGAGSQGTRGGRSPVVPGPKTVVCAR